MARRLLRGALIGAGALVLGMAGLWVWATGGGAKIGTVPTELITLEGSAPPTPRADGGLRVVSWNIAWGYGWGSEGSGAPRSGEEITARVDAMAQVLKRLDADVVLLQEVDLGAARSGYVDQARRLAEGAGYGHVAEVVSWQKGFLPFPGGAPSRWWGPIRSGGAILSRWPLSQGEALLFPLPEENAFWYNAFYLSRYLQQVQVEAPGGPVRVFNTHLEAFRPGTRMRQAAEVSAHLKALNSPRTVFGGDLNTVPPEATLRKGYPDEPATNHEQDRTLVVLRDTPGLTEALDGGAREEDTFTFPAHARNRRLDHLFYGAAWKSHRAWVDVEAGDLSDHLPIVVDLLSDAANPAGPAAPSP